MSTPVPCRRLALAVTLLAAVAARAQDAGPAAYRQHLARGDVGVEVWTVPGVPLEYEIEVRRAGEPAARLSGNSRGPLVASTLADLDGDGLPEVLLLFDAPDPRHALRLYEWNDRILDPIAPPAPPAPAIPGSVRGQYRLDGDALLWEYALYAQPSDPRPRERGAWRYDFGAGAWSLVAIEDGRPSLLERLPFIGDDDAAADAAPAAPGPAAPQTKRSLLDRLPFVGDDREPEQDDAVPAEAPVVQTAPAAREESPPPDRRRSLLDRLPFVGDDDAVEAADDATPAAQDEPPATKKERSLLDRLPFVGDDEVEAADDDAAKTDTPAPDAEPAAPDDASRFDAPAPAY